jgi:hypothetical protein
MYAKMAYNGFGLGEGTILTILKIIGIEIESRSLINHKCGCRALNRHFCPTRVSGGFYY